MELYNIIAGVLTAGFLLFLGSAHNLARKQKIIATRLIAYLLYWRSQINESRMHGFYYHGLKWYEEFADKVKSGGSIDDILKIEAYYKQKIEDLKESIEKGEIDQKIDKDDIQRRVHKLPKSYIEQLVADSTLVGQNIIEGKTFISDEEAGHLEPGLCYKCIELKMNLLKGYARYISLLQILISDIDNLQFQNYAEEISQLYWLGMKISRDIELLMPKLEAYKNDNILSLTMRNINMTYN